MSHCPSRDPFIPLSCVCFFLALFPPPYTRKSPFAQLRRYLADIIIRAFSQCDSLPTPQYFFRIKSFLTKPDFYKTQRQDSKEEGKKDPDPSLLAVQLPASAPLTEANRGLQGSLSGKARIELHGEGVACGEGWGWYRERRWHAVT